MLVEILLLALSALVVGLLVALARLYSIIKRNLIARRKSEARFLTLLDNAPDATLIVDEHGTIQMASAQVKATFGQFVPSRLVSSHAPR